MTENKQLNEHFKLKTHFITGLVLLLPITLTVIIVAFLVNLLTEPFVGAVRGILESLGIFNRGFWFLTPSQVVHIVSKFLILLFLFVITVLLGIFTRWVLFHYFIRMGDYVLHRIPLINTIYKTSQEVIKTIFTQDTRSFKQVVLLPFPNENTYAVGLVTRENLEGLTLTERAAVFVPTTPNPTSGFLMMAKQEDLIYLDMKIEDALKYVISCGVILGEFKHLSKEEIQSKAQSKMVIKHEE
ncbi:MAG: DUF502 domain-containing protein [Chlamydiales bacterium]